MSGADAWSEDRVHRWLAEQPWPADLAGSRGHDAAVLHPLGGRPALCTDQCIESVHFESDAPALEVGGKAVLRTLSDLAATAAVPRAVTLAVAAHPRVTQAWIQDCLGGAQQAAKRHGAELVAGDLSQTAGPLVLSVTALGSVDLDLVPVGRDRAQPGQSVILTGPVGGSLASGRHLAPAPRFAAGRALWREFGATAMMDVSDGLAWDLFRLARASGLAIRLDSEAVSIHADAVAAAIASGRTALDHALHDGEDHELIATIPAERVPGAIDGGWVHIGTCGAGEGLTLVTPEGAERWSPGDGGWRHGAGR